ncbi:MAG: mechanosensitive ion channel family protein [Candidatus Susulua stagnicola]|nr:mechanosensitive ion channel family protein [Candidatus Susulua stagnicola]
MFNEIAELSFLNNRVLDYLICVGIFLVSVIVIKIFELIILKKIKKWAKKSVTTLDDFVVSVFEKVVAPFLYFGALYLSVQILALGTVVTKIINIVGIAVLTIVIVRIASALIAYGFEIYSRKAKQGSASDNSLKGILKVIRFVLWAGAVIFFLDNLGFKISAVIAGLGIGGVAIALAAQAVLQDLFSYFSILFDRPFEIGDFIIVGDLLGTIEHIGIKTTRIRSLGGEQLVFSNSDLTNSRVRNYKRMQKRRVVFKLGVVYDTPLKSLKEIPQVIEEVIKSIKNTIFDRAHFSSYGDFNLVFEVVYYVLSSDYNKYMDIQQEINFLIKEEFEKRKIEFAFPTQTIHLEK